VRSEGFYVKNSNDTSWDRTDDLPICSTAHCCDVRTYTFIVIVMGLLVIIKIKNRDNNKKIINIKA